VYFISKYKAVDNLYSIPLDSPEDGDYFDEFDAIDEAYNYKFKIWLIRGLDAALMESHKTKGYYDYPEPDRTGPNRKWLIGGMMSYEINDDEF